MHFTILVTCLTCVSRLIASDAADTIDPFHITTFPAVQYMIEGIDFTSRCVIQVDKFRKNHAKIHSQLFFYEGTCGNMTSEVALLQSDGSSVEIIINEQYDDNGDMWVIVEFTIFNTTDSKSGCYHCFAASFDHTDHSFSDVIFMQNPFNITSYEPATTSVERGSNVTLSCEITVDKDYDMNLLYVFYRYYFADKSVRYDPEITVDSENMTITAELTIESVNIQHIGLYECYVRSIPADYYIDSDDEYYEVGQNITLNVINTAEPADSDNGKDRSVMIVVLVTLVTVILGTAMLILIVIICIKKRRLLKLSRSTQYNEYCEEPTTISAVNSVATQPVVYHITPKSNT